MKKGAARPGGAWVRLSPQHAGRKNRSPAKPPLFHVKHRMQKPILSVKSIFKKPKKSVFYGFMVQRQYTVLPPMMVRSTVQPASSSTRSAR